MGRKPYSQEKINDIAKKLNEFIDKNPLPFLEAFELSYDSAIDISDHIQADDKNNWLNNPNFLAAYKKAKKTLLINGLTKSLAKEIDTGMFIFILKNVFGWRDSVDLQGANFETKNIVQVFIPQVKSREEVARECIENNRIENT